MNTGMNRCGRALFGWAFCVLGALGCGSSETAEDKDSFSGLAGVGAAGTAGAAGVGNAGAAGVAGATATPGTGIAETGGIGGAAGMIPLAGTGVPMAGTGVPMAGTGVPMAGTGVPMAGTGMPMAGMDAAGAAGNAGPIGPEDGDPSSPVFAIADVPCGGPSGGFGGGLANHMMDGRDMIVTYPCNKHAGAPMTFFLNLHGTTPVAQHFYQHGYFAIHQFTASHNIIVVTPSSVVTQWGNGDNGEDAPHLMNIINWVYETFHGDGKLDIRAMWVGGHSWGAMFSTTYVCEQHIADKVQGAVLMSGIGRAPACGDRISTIFTLAEDDISTTMNQGTYPMAHGCDASMESMVGNNTETYWPGCDPGFEHANYFMLGKMHASSIDEVVVERIADLIKSTRM